MAYRSWQLWFVSLPKRQYFNQHTFAYELTIGKADSVDTKVVTSFTHPLPSMTSHETMVDSKDSDYIKWYCNPPFLQISSTKVTGVRF